MQTRASLLMRIRDPHDSRAWMEFVNLYAPLLHAYALKSRMQDADAADLAQDTLRLVLRAAPEFVYEPTRGSFRGWLFTIARNEIRKFVTRKRNRDRGSGDSEVRQMLAEHPVDEPTEQEWDREYQLHLFHWAAKRVKPEFKPSSWQAFWKTVVDHEPIETVAESLGISTGAVYIARSRVTARLRQEIETVQEDNA
jgi:RNA polymerase sigma factor (sigma-70 family)